MAKIRIDAWATDKTRRDTRLGASLCPMCGKVKREDDVYCSDPCKTSDQKGEASKE